jgi:hypothetical protein
MLEKPTAGEHPVVVPVIRSMRDTTVCGSRKIAARHTDAKLGQCPRTQRPVTPFAETDHIAPVRSVFKIDLNEGDVTFVLTFGDHNAGVVSEPGDPRRHFRTHRRRAAELFKALDERFAAAKQHEGS